MEIVRSFYVLICPARKSYLHKWKRFRKSGMEAENSNFS